MKLTAKRLECIAEKAAIDLNKQEEQYYLDELNKIIDLFEQIKEVDTEQITPYYTTEHEQDFLEETYALKAWVSEYLMMPLSVLE
ncbi:MAG: Asp-tRNA(Asn)/Glu-tRNA(Gln) amidotransferase subunit GatC [Cellulosilyticaceae bacterium]